MATRGPLVALFITLALPAPAQQSTPHTAPAEDRITIEGCLQTADRDRSRRNLTSATSASDVATTRETPRLFMLTDARRVLSGTTIGTAGVATTRNADGSVTQEDPRRASKTYAVVAPDDVLLRFAGRLVEVEGIASRAAREEHAGAEAPVDRSTERLTVTRVRLVADSCARRTP